MRLGIFGGTFNPIHLGHLIVAEEIRQSFRLQRIIFVPSARPPHKSSRGMIDAEHRLQMTRLAVEGNPAFDVSAIEREQKGLSYSVRTLEFFREEWGDETSLFFILGVDSFGDVANWHQPERLIELCNFIVTSRPGYSFEDALRILSTTFGIPAPKDTQEIALPNGHFLHFKDVTPIGISSTLIRERVLHGRSVKYLLPESVESYILSHGLYKTK